MIRYDFLGFQVKQEPTEDTAEANTQNSFTEELNEQNVLNDPNVSLKVEPSDTFDQGSNYSRISLPSLHEEIDIKCESSTADQKDVREDIFDWTEDSSRTFDICKVNGPNQQCKVKIESDPIGVDLSNVTHLNDDNSASGSSMKNVLDGEFYCDLCPYHTDSRLRLICHLRTHNRDCKINNNSTVSQNTKTSPKGPFTCHACDKSYSRKYNLDKHFGQKHNGEKYVDEKIDCAIRQCSQQDQQISVNTSSYICDKVLTTKPQLKAYASSNTCDICNKSFRTKNYMAAHLRTHTGEKPYSCDMCKKSFNLKGNLRSHLKTHSGEKSHSCTICNSNFTEKVKFMQHLNEHSGEKPFPCNICDKSYHLKKSLQKHMKIHSSVKPHSCDVCNKSFFVKFELQNHLRIHSGDKPYSCEVCKKSFRLSRFLREHLKIHSGKREHSCNVCGKKFVQKGYLRVHMKIHSGETRFSCDICKKEYYLKTTLRKHMRLHTGEKPYACVVCRQSFRLKYTLDKHILRNH